jgi:Fe-S-cluster containining protein
VDAPPLSAPDIRDEDALCMRCGLCCDGTLYGSVSVQESERARLERVGLHVVQRGEVTALPQPCRALRGCLCSVYPDRPSTCASYECALRKEVRAGARGLVDALDAVAQVKSLMSTLREDLKIDPAASVWESILALEPPKTPDEEREWASRHAATLRAVVQLIELGRGVFDPRFGGGGSAR